LFGTNYSNTSRLVLLTSWSSPQPPFLRGARGDRALTEEYCELFQFTEVLVQGNWEWGIVTTITIPHSHLETSLQQQAPQLWIR
jgi:hypothetical protein